jgi:hypothetical protein
MKADASPPENESDNQESRNAESGWGVVLKIVLYLIVAPTALILAVKWLFGA